MLPPDLLDNTFTHNMVRQTSKRLDTNNIRHTAMDQLHHLASQKPSLTSLVSRRYDRLCHLRQIRDIRRRSKVTALRQCLIHRLTEPFDRLDAPVRHRSLILLKSKELTLKVLVIETVIDKVDQIRADCLGTLCFQKFCQMIVRSRKELDKDLTNNTNSRLLLTGDRDHIKLMYHLMAHLLELAVADTASRQERDHPLLPDLMLTVDDSLFHLIRTHAVNAFHQDISKHCTIAYSLDQRKRQLESRIAFQTT